MNAFHLIADEMPKAAKAITAPATRPGRPMIRARGVSPTAANPLGEAPHGPATHIEPWMAAAFADLVHAAETDAPYALLSCFMNGKPAVVIAYLREDGDRSHVLPLFVAVQAGMAFQPHDDEPPD
jgi:hypothetical protein